jgi:hypothetical protein
LQNASRGINLFNEKPLHAALKAWYIQPGDRVEVNVDGYIIDIVRGDLLIEIQTSNFAALKKKLTALVKQYPVRLVYPIATEKWIVRMPEKGDHVVGRRRSPKRGIPADVFEELVSFPELISDNSFSIEVLLVRAEEVRRQDRRRGWRRKGWVVDERRLLKVLDRLVMETPADVVSLVPEDLLEPFTTSDLACAIGRPRRLARRMAYCLRSMGCIIPVGKQGNAILYARTDTRKYL